MTPTRPKPPLVYVLHSGNLYGTERMALYTVAALSQEFEPVILAPNGPVIQEARARGFQVFACAGMLSLATRIRSLLARHSQLAYMSTGVVHSAICLIWNMLYRRQVSHLHLVHGGASERLSYGRKRYLNRFPVQFVAVSEFVRQRLVANGVDSKRVEVIENFLPESQLTLPRRPPFQGEPLRRLIVISRLDPEKRVALLLDALEQSPDLQHLETHVYGSGWEAQTLRERALKNNLRVTFKGFQPDIQPVLTKADILVHLCPVEPFGLAIIEATAAGVPVLVPDAGGAASLVDDNWTGFHFRANDAASLAERLRQVLALNSAQLNATVARARDLHQTRFSASNRISQYRQLLAAGLA